MRHLQLELKDNPYTIYIGSDLLDNAKLIASHCEGEKVLIVSNQVVAPLYLETVQNSLGNKSVHQVIIEDGEVHKSRESFFKIVDYLVENNFRRNDTLIALGGGVIGDLSGFAAASFQRGMNLIQIPTSLLSQVDSSVGGKTAINHRLGKNLVGAFYQPSAVFIDVNTLDTLPDREYYSGFGEVVKYALLGESNIRDILIKQTDDLLSRNKQVLTDLIYYCCQMKAVIVAKDEKEKGERALLNLGHTFAHALETLTAYNYYLHGEAVSVGLLMALSLSAEKELINIEKVSCYESLLKQLNLPVKIRPKIEIAAFLSAMQKDKKNQSEALRLVLAKPDCCVLQEESDTDLVAKIIKEYVV